MIEQANMQPMMPDAAADAWAAVLLDVMRTMATENEQAEGDASKGRQTKPRAYEIVVSKAPAAQRER